MNKSLYYSLQGIFLILILFATGCTKQHSVQVNNGTVTLYYYNDEAREIFFASSADHFHSHPAIKGAGDIWQVAVPQNKEFVYFYIVDGVITVPDCPNRVQDDFGNKNCLYVPAM